MGKYVIKFEAKEIAWNDCIAFVEANSMEEAYNTVKQQVKENNPFADFDAEWNGVNTVTSRVIKTDEYVIDDSIEKAVDTEDNWIEKEYQNALNSLEGLKKRYIISQRKIYLRNIKNMLKKISKNRNNCYDWLLKAIDAFGAVEAYPQKQTISYGETIVWCNAVIIVNQDGYEKALIDNIDWDFDPYALNVYHKKGSQFFKEPSSEEDFMDAIDLYVEYPEEIFYLEEVTK